MHIKETVRQQLRLCRTVENGSGGELTCLTLFLDRFDIFFMSFNHLSSFFVKQTFLTVLIFSLIFTSHFFSRFISFIAILPKNSITILSSRSHTSQSQMQYCSTQFSCQSIRLYVIVCIPVQTCHQGEFNELAIPTLQY